MPADIIGPIEPERSQHSQQLLRTVITIAGWLSTPASHLSGMSALLGQQACQDRGSRPMRYSASRHLDCFEVQSGIFPERGKR